MSASRRNSEAAVAALRLSNPHGGLSPGSKEIPSRLTTAAAEEAGGRNSSPDQRRFEPGSSERRPRARGHATDRARRSSTMATGFRFLAFAATKLAKDQIASNIG